MTNNLLDGKTGITDATKLTEEESKIITSVIGRVLAIQAETTCRVMYKDADGKYHAIDAKLNSYASDNVEYNFAVPSDAKEVVIVVAGDYDGDGTIEAEDVTDLQKSVLGKDGATLTDNQKIACDANGDGEITAVDLLMMKAAQLGKKELDW